MVDGSLDFMQTNNIQAMCWSPMGKVFKRNDTQSERILNLCQKLSEKYDAPATTLILAWVLKHPAGILPVFGSTDFNRIKDLHNANLINLELQDWFAFWEASIGNSVA
jgi:predicted oxidoreductase